ncbi:stage II sporulation protein M [Thermococcus sp. Bubb.Bath]|uniref:stage II sporulation protein M n=1 Tax=Thermococcus sp. Bubb.Bath TaxID=1638242 RepID=UPI00143B667B|nr:stage II sporulation protein M [Thermococcus sp. Bubb.Bath]NJF24511.1 stage II sporulation protein M [Thermococcus sp. Bubb.Bath]
MRGKGQVWRIFLVMTAIFLGFTLVGAIVVYLSPDLAGKFTAEIAKTLLSKVGRDSFGFRLFVGIFFNNAGAATTAYALGVLFGIVPVLIVAFNGLMLGVVTTYLVHSGAISVQRVLLAILPHGIIEIPAILLAATSGVLLYKALLRGGGKEMAMKSLKLYAISIGMLLLAAFIEAFITPQLAGIK